jgi:hypothetical protein
MKSGFVQVQSHMFYADVWPHIKNKVEAVESNWTDAKKGVRPIIIEWGYKDESTGSKVILAISRSDYTGDEHWVIEGLFKTLTAASPSKQSP